MPSTPTKSDVKHPNYSRQKHSFLQSQRTEPHIVDSDALLDFNIFKPAFKENFFSPVSPQLIDGARVLNITAGGPAWVKEMSKTYANSEFNIVVIGKSFPHPESLPKNAKHEPWDLKGKLPYQDSTFDFIYVECIIFHLRTEEWLSFLLELFRIVKSSGFVELQEPELWRDDMGPVTEIFTTTMLYSFRASGINIRAGRELADLLKQAGFIDITKSYATIPCGWGSPEGVEHGKHFKKLLEDITPFLIKSLGWTSERLSEEIEVVLEEQVEGQGHSNFHKAFAKKP